MLLRYGSVEEFAERARRVTLSNRTIRWGSDSDEWFGGITYDEALSKSIIGDDSLVPEAQKLMDKLETLDVELTIPTWQPSPAGAYPIVPEYISGYPDCMRIRKPAVSDMAPLGIYVSTTSSAGISADVMQKRGVAILALLLKLQQVRPISLYLLVELYGQSDGACIEVIEVQSRPLALATACFVLSSVGFARHLTYSVAKEEDGFEGSWPTGYHRNWESEIRQRVSMSPDDLYIPAATMWDQMVTSPVEWVNDKVRRYARVEE